VALLLTASIVSPAYAQQAEVGASLFGVTAILEDDAGTTIGMPTSGVGLLTPGVYASFFLGSRMAVEPRFSFIAVFGDDGEFGHILNFTGQFDYFLRDIGGRAPYLFANGGVLEEGGDVDIKTAGAGVGFRIPLGGRLVVRMEGQYNRLMSDFADRDIVAFTVSIGGMFRE
jgi:hypothetical protein